MPRRTTPDPFAARIGARIRELRHEYDMSLAALADASHVSKGHLSSIEQGLVGITIATTFRVAEGFGVPPLYLVAFVEEDPTVEVVELLRKLPKEQFVALHRELKKNAKAAEKAARKAAR